MTSETGRGAQTFKIGEEDVTVFFNLNAQFALEAELDKAVSAIITELEYATFSATTARAVLWAGLQGGGRDKITLEEAGVYAIDQRVALHLQVALARSQASHEEIEMLADKVEDVDKAQRQKTNEILDKTAEELRRPPTKKRGGKDGKRSRA